MWTLVAGVAVSAFAALYAPKATRVFWRRTVDSLLITLLQCFQGITTMKSVSSPVSVLNS
jgi:hypothetical protein